MKTDIQTSIISWLTMRLRADLSSKHTKVWLFGSVASNEFPFGDCDLLVVYDRHSLQSILRIIKAWKRDFRRDFSLNLHVTSLTNEEFKEGIPLIETIFQKPNRKLFPTHTKGDEQ